MLIFKTGNFPPMEDAFGVRLEPVYDLNTGRVLFREMLAGYSAGVCKDLLSWSVSASVEAEFDSAMLMSAMRLSEVVGGRVSVNICPSSVNKITLPDRDLSGIAFELVERRASRNANVAEFARRVRGMGAWVVLDDLGDQHATLQAVKFLRPDVVKVSGRHSGDELFLGAVKSLIGDTLMVVECIDTPEKLASARRVGVRYGQGHLLGANMRFAGSGDRISI